MATIPIETHVPNCYQNIAGCGGLPKDLKQFLKETRDNLRVYSSDPASSALKLVFF